MEKMKGHKNWVKDVFDGASSGYGEKGCFFFNYFGEKLAEFASPAEGAQILDVATGKGAVLFPAAKIIGPQGRAVGVDLSHKMIEEASKKAPLSWIELQQMDSEHLLFADHSFDMVFCAFALFFFSHLSQALSECRRVLKPNGTIAVSFFSKQALLDMWITEKVKKYGITSPLATVILDRMSVIEKQLVETGFTLVKTREESKVFWHESAEAWWESLWTHGMRSRLESLSHNDLEELREEALSYAGNGRIGEERHVLYVIART